MPFFHKNKKKYLCGMMKCLLCANVIQIERKLWPLCRKTLIFERKKGIKTLKRGFFKKMKEAYLRNDEMLIVCKFHPNRTKIVACSRVNRQTDRHTEISEPLTKQKNKKKLKKL